VHTHVWGPQTKEMVRRFKDGDVDGARRLNDEMQPAYDLLRIQTNPIPIKAAVNLLGHNVGGYRLPMVEPTDDELAQVRACLVRGGVLQPAPA
jgi:4-hydroxy-tetrahydrodipicolinate synthase